MKKAAGLLVALCLLLLCTAALGEADQASSYDSLIDHVMADTEKLAALLSHDLNKGIGANGSIAVQYSSVAENIYPGDPVTLQAKVSGDGAYSVRWEVLDLNKYMKGSGALEWSVVGKGETYTVIAEASTRNRYYRAVAQSASGEVASTVCSIPVSRLMDKPAEKAEGEAEELAQALGSITRPISGKESTPKTVSVVTDCPAVLAPGEPVTLIGVLEGFEGVDVSYQWECDQGAGYLPIDGANHSSYVYAATIESLSWNWRLVVSYNE